MMQKKCRVQRGFTLIEVMIAGAILAILAAIAIPNYIEHVAKVRRGDAQAALFSLANALERYKTNNVGTATTGYTGAAVPAIHPAQAPIDGTTKYYNLSITLDGTAPNTYVISATPITGSPQAGDACGIFQMNHNGDRSLGGSPSKSLEYCWR